MPPEADRSDRSDADPPNGGWGVDPSGAGEAGRCSDPLNGGADVCAEPSNRGGGAESPNGGTGGGGGPNGGAGGCGGSGGPNGDDEAGCPGETDRGGPNCDEGEEYDVAEPACGEETGGGE